MALIRDVQQEGQHFGGASPLREHTVSTLMATTPTVVWAGPILVGDFTLEKTCSKEEPYKQSINIPSKKLQGLRLFQKPTLNNVFKVQIDFSGSSLARR